MKLNAATHLIFGINMLRFTQQCIDTQNTDVKEPSDIFTEIISTSKKRGSSKVRLKRKDEEEMIRVHESIPIVIFAADWECNIATFSHQSK